MGGPGAENGYLQVKDNFCQAIVAMAEKVTFIDPPELKEILAGSSETKEKTLIIDVRDEEFAEGHIKGSTNVVVDKFKDDDDVDAIIAAHLKGKGKETVIVHCQLSQQRGPFAARRLASRLEVAELADLQVQVLRGGFEKWDEAYGSDKSLTERGPPPPPEA